MNPRVGDCEDTDTPSSRARNIGCVQCGKRAEVGDRWIYNTWHVACSFACLLSTAPIEVSRLAFLSFTVTR